VLAANRAARALFADWPSRPPTERNMLHWMLTDPAPAYLRGVEREAGASWPGFVRRLPDTPATRNLRH